jgi:hypothetical protein
VFRVKARLAVSNVHLGEWRAAIDNVYAAPGCELPHADSPIRFDV